jgi:hypothetical protein
LVVVGLFGAACNLTTISFNTPGPGAGNSAPPPVSTPGRSASSAPLATLPAFSVAPIASPPTVSLPPQPSVGVGLISHVPAEIASTCSHMLVAYQGSTDGLKCYPESGVAVAYYVQFADQASMDAEFDDQWSTEASDAVNGGLCETADSKGVGRVTYDDGSVGRYLCYPSTTLNAYWLYWTNQTLNILGYAAVDGNDAGPLFDWWQGAGPIAAGQGNVPPGQPTPIPPAQATPPPVVEPPVGNNGPGLDCAGYPPAPALAVTDIARRWTWTSTTYYYEGGDSYTYVRGSVDLRTDMTWSGDQIVVGANGPFQDAVSAGPGTWSFDGYTLTFTFDDGSDPVTYDTARLSQPVSDETGSYLVLTLEQAGAGNECVVWLLRSDPL